MTLVVLFPGQGVQHPDMLRWVDGHPEARPALAALAAHVGADWRAHLGADPAWGTSNAVAQCLITGLSLAAWAVLSPRLPTPTAVAGYSVGELAAGAAAGLYDAETALFLASQRAAAMDHAAAHAEGGLLAVGGVAADEVARHCDRHGLAIAIHLGPDRWVLGGLAVALTDSARALTEAGATVTPLRVRVASHTSWMREAAEAFSKVLAPRPWPTAACWVVSNLDGAARRDAAGLKAALSGQIDHPVQWSRSLDTLGERRPACVLEAGPGTSLSRLWQERHPAVPVRSTDEFHGDDAIVAWASRHLAT